MSLTGVSGEQFDLSIDDDIENRLRRLFVPITVHCVNLTINDRTASFTPAASTHRSIARAAPAVPVASVDPRDVTLISAAEQLADAMQNVVNAANPDSDDKINNVYSSAGIMTRKF